MKLIVGLGNPEPKYLNNRHNVGCMAIDLINANFKNKYKRKPAIASEKFLQSIVWDYSPFAVLAKPMKFMNDSGIAVKKLVDAYRVTPSDLYVIHDDLDIALGGFKIQMAKGPKVHNGIGSIEKELGTKNFGRIRIGIENREKGEPARNAAHSAAGGEYVLQDFTIEEKRIINWVVQKINHEELFENLRYR